MLALLVGPVLAGSSGCARGNATDNWRSAMAVCELCGKKPVSGHNVSHSNRRTNRRFKPNVQPVTIYINGERKRLRICTRCLRTLYKDARMAEKAERKRQKGQGRS